MIVGCIHGRFQPFHNGHFEYLEAACQKSDRVIIGITQYQPDIRDRESPEHRLIASQNPFSYWERAEIIWAAADAAGIARKNISIVPFPIHAPDSIKYYVDTNCVMYTTIYDRWNIEKIRRLREIGFSVQVLWRRRIKAFEGKKVRFELQNDPSRIASMVPVGAFEKIVELYKKKRVIL
jgi:cytidyltransferase-like protein